MIEPFTLWGNTVDVDAIEKKLTGLDWDKYTFRQKTFSVHSNTKTIPLLWNEKPNHDVIVKHPHYTLFEQELSEIQTKFPPGRLHTAILINLPAGLSIPTHRDAAQHFKLYNRIHIPIITNPKCLFTVGGETIHMKAGELWEINKHQVHSVENNGEEDRIHLIIDCDFE